MGRIVYVSWPAHEISGGIKMVFRHVEALVEAGFSACVATPDAKPPTWFATTAPIISTSQMVPDTDILVFPENHSGFLKEFAGWHNIKVVFCQNQFMIYRGLDGALDYADFGVFDMIVPGYACADFCRKRFRAQNIAIIPNYIEDELFHARGTKKLQIAYAPRKRAMEAQVIRDFFRSRGDEFRKMAWVEIAHKKEEEVAEILGESALFLSLCRFESLGLSLLEALASGCIAAGFTGQGGRDYAATRNGFWAAEDDCLEAAEQLTQAARMVLDGGNLYEDMVKQSILTAHYYTRERFKENLVAFWKQKSAG